jgi:hypothetical protein
VAGNPTTATDPTGHRLYAGDGGGDNCLSLLDCGILDFGGNASVDGKGNVNVGDGQQMHIDSHNNQSPKHATSVYRWCPDTNHCADAVGYSGKQLATLIKANRDRLDNDQTWVKRIQDYIAEISFGVGISTMIIVVAAAFLIQLAAMPEDEVPPDVRAAISAGSTAGGWTGSGVTAALEATEHWLESDISDTKSKLALENRAAQSNGTLWYVGAIIEFSSLEGYVSVGGYWVVDGGTTPGNAVKSAVAKIL